MDEKRLIYHNSYWSFYRRPFGAVPSGTAVTLRVAVHASYAPMSVKLRVWRNDAEELYDMFAVSAADDISTVNAAYAIPGAAESDSLADFGLDRRDQKEYADFIRSTQEQEGLSAAQSRLAAPSGHALDVNGGSEARGLDRYVIYETVYDASHDPTLVWYYFIVERMDGSLRYFGDYDGQYGGDGCERAEPPPSYQITVFDPAYETPRWIKRQVMYQIYPDRFYSERKTPLTQEALEKKRPDYIFHENWRDQPVYKPDPRTGEIMNNDFFGGNLRGITAKLPYLKDLGVGVIYLNPIFESYSNHRYDTGDYRKVDSTLGTKADFTRLCARARSLGIRVILDGVFNHTGADSVYFNKYGYYPGVGAYQSKTSKYSGWYRFDSHPGEYDSWWGIDTLPNVNEDNPTFRNFIVRSKDSVVKRWIRSGSSGWRLDVVDELPDDFLRDLRTAVKSEDEDAVIIGEVWEEATTKVAYGVRREYLLGRELDSVMNYVFRDKAMDFLLGRIPSWQFVAEMRRLAERYPRQSLYACMNLIGGHDIARALTILSEPPGDLTRDQKAMHKATSRKRKIGVKRLKMGAALQMAMPGAPNVYYGDEVGMTGFEDPFNRGAFPWDDMDEDLLDWYKRVISLRNAFEPLQTGTFEMVYAGNGADPWTPWDVDCKTGETAQDSGGSADSGAAETGGGDGSAAERRETGGRAAASEVFAIIRAIRDRADVFGDRADNGFVIVAFNRDTELPGELTLDLSGYSLPALYAPFSNGASKALHRGKITLRIPPLGVRALTFPPIDIP